MRILLRKRPAEVNNVTTFEVHSPTLISLSGNLVKESLCLCLAWVYPTMCKTVTMSTVLKILELRRTPGVLVHINLVPPPPVLNGATSLSQHETYHCGDWQSLSFAVRSLTLQPTYIPQLSNIWMVLEMCYSWSGRSWIKRNGSGLKKYAHRIQIGHTKTPAWVSSFHYSSSTTSLIALAQCSKTHLENKLYGVLHVFANDNVPCSGNIFPCGADCLPHICAHFRPKLIVLLQHYAYGRCSLDTHAAIL